MASKNVPVPQGSKSVTVAFIREKETPGTFRFVEVGERDTHRVGAIYLKKATVVELGNPQGIKVTITGV